MGLVQETMFKFIVLALSIALLDACNPGSWDVAEKIDKSSVEDDSVSTKGAADLEQELFEEVDNADIQTNDIEGEGIPQDGPLKGLGEADDDGNLDDFISSKEENGEFDDEIETLMQDVEMLLGRLTEEQMSRLQELLGLHYAGDHQFRDNMLDSLVTGDEVLKQLVDLIKLLEEKGAKINLLDEDEETEEEKNEDDTESDDIMAETANEGQ